LTVKSNTSSVTVSSSGEPVYRVQGKRRRRGRVKLSVFEQDERLISLLEADTARITVTGPFNAFTAICDTSSISMETGDPLLYVGARCDTSSMRIDAPLRRDGHVYLDLDTSSVKSIIRLAEPGRYPIEVKADTSNVKIEVRTPYPVYYTVKKSNMDSSRLQLDGVRELPGGIDEDAVLLELELDLDTSFIKIAKTV